MIKEAVEKLLLRARFTSSFPQLLASELVSVFDLISKHDFGLSEAFVRGILSNLLERV